jgi:pantoate--beta-alanine ligase
MGALHRGHAALFERARRVVGGGGTVVASIFVNPAQFGPDEDFHRYPRPLAADKALCQSSGVDLVFHPAPGEMYHSDRSLEVRETRLSIGLCGGSRPGHFDGVCLVVAKLFNIVQPDLAVFGEKDWQQLAIIRRMVRDLDFPITIVGHPTQRESDGLAISSRNAYLTAEERAVAPRIYEALRAAAALPWPAGKIVSETRRRLEKMPGARVDYVACVDAETLAPVRKIERPVMLAAAVFLGRTRLIDHIRIQPRT